MVHTNIEELRISGPKTSLRLQKVFLKEAWQVQHEDDQYRPNSCGRGNGGTEIHFRIQGISRAEVEQDSVPASGLEKVVDTKTEDILRVWLQKLS